MPLVIGGIFAAAHDGQVGFKKGAAAVLDEGKQLLQVAFEIVEEDAADAAGLAAVGQEEIVVAPFFEAGMIDRSGMAGAGPLPDAMEVDDVFLEGIKRSQIRAAAEPLLVSLGEEAEVGVHGGDEGIARVQHQGDAGGGEGAAAAGNLGGKLLRHVPEDIGEVDAGFLEDAAAGQHAGAAAAAAGALPDVLLEAPAAVALLQGGANPVLQVPEIAAGSMLHCLHLV